MCNVHDLSLIITITMHLFNFFSSGIVIEKHKVTEKQLNADLATVFKGVCDWEGGRKSRLIGE